MGSSSRTKGCQWAESGHPRGLISGRGPVTKDGERETREAGEGEKSLWVKADKGEVCLHDQKQ